MTKKMQTFKMYTIKNIILIYRPKFTDLKKQKIYNLCEYVIDIARQKTDKEIGLV